MNYASVLFVAFLGVALLWYLVWGKKNFDGPAILRTDDGVVGIQELATIDAQETSQGSDSSGTKSKKARKIEAIAVEQSAGMI